MAAYNAEKTLQAAVSSVLNQDYAHLELIVCDDASSDNSWQLLCDIAARDDRIHLLQNERNLGAGPSRNRCIDRAKGDYIALMDADDISMPSRITQQVGYLEHHAELAFVGTKGRFFNRESGDSEEYYWFVAKPRCKDFLMTLPYVHASLMFRAEVLRRLGGYRDVWTVKRSEDYDMMMRAYAMGYRGENLSTPLYEIRLDENTYKRRKYRYRFGESLTKWSGFTDMGLMPGGIPYALKPLIVGLLPNGLLNRMKREYYAKAGK